MNSRKNMAKEILDLYMKVYPSFSKEKTILKHLNQLKTLSESHSSQDYTYNLTKVVQQLKYYDYLATDEIYEKDRKLIIEVLSNIYNINNLGDILNNYRKE